MRIAAIIIRVLLGALMGWASIAFFFNLMGDQPKPSETMGTVMAGFMATKYIFPVAKVIELLAAISLLSGKFMRLMLLVLLPISVNIFLLHTVTEVHEVAIGIFVLAANLFLIYANWGSYKHLVTP